MASIEELTAADQQGMGFAVEGYGAIAWAFCGAETEPDEDTIWSGYEVPTGRVVMVMVGDDRRFTFDPEEVQVLDPDAYCHQCGQVGCTHDGRERDEDHPDILCPECHEPIWDLAIGHKLHKCWNTAGHADGGTLAFD